MIPTMKQTPEKRPRCLFSVTSSVGNPPSIGLDWRVDPAARLGSRLPVEWPYRRWTESASVIENVSFPRSRANCNSLASRTRQTYLSMKSLLSSSIQTSLAKQISRSNECNICREGYRTFCLSPIFDPDESSIRRRREREGQRLIFLGTHDHPGGYKTMLACI